MELLKITTNKYCPWQEKYNLSEDQYETPSLIHCFPNILSCKEKNLEIIPAFATVPDSQEINIGIMKYSENFIMLDATLLVYER